MSIAFSEMGISFERLDTNPGKTLCKKTFITMVTKHVILGPDTYCYQVAWPYKTLESDKHVNGSRSSINTLIVSLTRKTYCLLYKSRYQTIKSNK